MCLRVIVIVRGLCLLCVHTGMCDTAYSWSVCIRVIVVVRGLCLLCVHTGMWRCLLLVRVYTCYRCSERALVAVRAYWHVTLLPLGLCVCVIVVVRGLCLLCVHTGMWRCLLLVCVYLLACCFVNDVIDDIVKDGNCLRS